MTKKFTGSLFIAENGGGILLNRNKVGSTSPLKMASDGIAISPDGKKILPNGTMEIIAHDPRISWPDTFSIGSDGYLYVIVNQLQRLARCSLDGEEY